MPLFTLPLDNTSSNSMGLHSFDHSPSLRWHKELESNHNITQTRIVPVQYQCSRNSSIASKWILGCRCYVCQTSYRFKFHFKYLLQTKYWYVNKTKNWHKSTKHGMRYIKLGMTYIKLGISYTHCLHIHHKVLQTALHTNQHRGSTHSVKHNYAHCY